MHLVIATPLSAPDIGGPATHVAMVERLLRDHGISHSIVSFRQVRHYHSIVRHPLYCWRLYRATKGADRIYVLDASSVGFAAYWVSRLRRIPLMVRIAGVTAWEIGMEKGQVHVLLDEFLDNPKIYPLSVRFRLWVEQFVLRRAERIIVPSEYFKRVVLKLSNVRDTRVEVMYSGFTPRHEANVLTETREQGLIVSAGRLVPWKGFTILIEALARVREHVPSAHLVILGDGKQREELEHQIEHMERELPEEERGRVVLAGSVGQDALQGYLARARVFALNTGYEGFSHQLLEAMDAGAPIVTTPAGGNTELIADRKEGLLVPYNDAETLANALIEVLIDAKLAQSLAYNAYRKAREFSDTRNADTLVSLLTSRRVPNT
jgi:glycosyltransferase involved in cell wall biosynthesis